MRKEEINISHLPITISDYLKEIYEVPLYQREYVWSEKIIDDFINELIIDDEFDDTFFGIILLKKKKIKTRVGYEIIDGQQRSVSFSLLLIILFLYGKELSRNKLVEFKLKEIEKKLKYKENSKVFPVITPSYNDKLLYDEILKAETFNDINEILKRNRQFSKRHLYKNANKIFQAIKNNPLNVRKWRKIVDNILNKIYVITITVNDSKNANKLFKSFNQKRVTLLLSDLLRNDIYLLGLENRYDETRINKILEKLNNIFERILKSGKIGSEEFLYYFLNSFNFQIKFLEGPKSHTKIISKNKLYSAFENILHNNYKKNLSKFISDLETSWKYLEPIIDPENYELNYFIGKEGKIKTKQKIEEFIYLYALRSFNIKKGIYIILATKLFSSGNYLKILRIITLFTIRHTFTTKDMKLLEGWLADAASQYFKNKSIISFKNKLNSFIDSEYENSVKRNFISEQFSNNRAKALLMLIHLKNKNFNRTFDDKFNDIEIEHIWPEKPSVTYLRKLKIDESVYNSRKKYLGNLMLCPQLVNSKAKNKEFDKKIEIYGEYRRRMYDTSTFIFKKGQWYEDDIKNRTDELLENFLKLFRI